MRRVVLACVSCWVLGVGASACLAALPGSWQEMLDTESVPRQKPWRTLQAAGYDRLGGYFDSGNFLRTEPDRRHILLDAKGPGVIDRLWFTYKGEFRSEPYDLLVYLDGQADPVIHVNLDELFLGARPPFVMPLAGLCGNPKFPGRFSYVPIGFQSSCLVVLQPTAEPDKYRYRENSAGETIPHVYYQITWRQLPAGSMVQPFAWDMTQADEAAFQQLVARWKQLGEPLAADAAHIQHHATEVLVPAGSMVQPFAWDMTQADEAAFQQLVARWKQLGEPPAPNGSHIQHHATEVLVPAGSQAVLAELSGAGTVTGLRLTDNTLSQVDLKCYWDGHPQAAVSAPCEVFFGGADEGGPGRTRSLWIGRRDDQYYCYLPMPYRTGARLVLESRADHDVTVKCELDLSDVPPAEDSGYLHATRYDHVKPVAGQDYVVLDVEGRGHFVGLVMDRPGHMEGDDRFYVDEETDPSIHGTGTEDFLNFAWGLSHTGSLALHGIVPQASGPVGYRFHLPAGVPFSRRLRVTWEHGHDLDRGVNLDERRYSGLVYYYLNRTIQETQQ